MHSFHSSQHRAFQVIFHLLPLDAFDPSGSDMQSPVVFVGGFTVEQGERNNDDGGE
ncbi:MAG: hypothetical protein GAK31_02575 [Stenotrophomonas maltophilia]|uniref:Uncharacterized protein n=1 Tax=Stenotrophomonas maltophilia TaxID=40324 RepID=A0A7V8FGF9_STEMA|nr:MAG: hypothetical protein GAK31_02575 [Stenotrophomonas maltophilia]